MSRIGEEVQALHHRSRPDLFVQPSAKPHHDFLASVLKSPDWSCLVTGGSVVSGFCVVEYQTARVGPFRVADDRAYLHQIAVTIAERGRGLGSALLEAARTGAAARGVRSIWLDSWSFNPGANDFFRSHGFFPMITVYESPTGI